MSPIVPRYELPPFLVGRVGLKGYTRWLQRKAAGLR